MSKVIVIARTRDSSIFIERFIKSYPMADKILIADGGSEDNTVELAIHTATNVVVDKFERRIARHGEWRNPHGSHINFLIDWAETYNPDWIVFDDVDCIPNYAVKRDWDKLFQTPEDFILINRVYIYKDGEGYFPTLTKPKILSGIQYESEYIPSLWAWRANKGFRAKIDDPFVHEFVRSPEKGYWRGYYPPYCLLHYFYPSDEYMQKKLAFYNKIRELGENVTVKDPKEYAGTVRPLEEWMKE